MNSVDKPSRAAIFCHESQKDCALFPGPDDPREFWQRAEDRNRNTAGVYNQIGLPDARGVSAADQVPGFGAGAGQLKAGSDH